MLFSYNLYLYRHHPFGDSLWVALSSVYIDGGYQYNETVIGNNWRL